METYWIVGSPCAGKTTIADMLGQEHNLRVYHLDRYYESYLRRAELDKHPYLTHIKGLGQRFLALPHEEQLERVKKISAEQFEFILADIATWREDDPDTPILVEGANIRIEDVLLHIETLNQLICIVPTEDFLFKTYPRRGTWVQDVLANFPDNERLTVFEQWMTRDSHHAQWAVGTATEHGVKLIEVDGSNRILENAAIVEAHFGLPPYLQEELYD